MAHTSLLLPFSVKGICHHHCTAADDDKVDEIDNVDYNDVDDATVLLMFLLLPLMFES